MRIITGRFYVLETIPGISGFKRWNERAYQIVTAQKARHNRAGIVGELLPIGEDYYRLEDGHLPEYQPKARTPEALEWLSLNPFASIVRLDPATRSIDVKPHWETR